MSEENQGVEGSANPDEVMVTINNRQVPVSKAEEVLRQMEHDLKSGYDRTLAQERERLQADITTERDRVATLLDQDKTWYDSHPQSQWRYYEPLVNGGKGELPMENIPVTKTDSPDMSAMKQEMDNLRSTMASLTEKTVLMDTENALKTRNVLLAKAEYGYADADAVTAKMLAHHQKTGSPATEPEIEQFIKQSHDHTAKALERHKAISTPKGDEPAGAVLPGVGGKPPSQSLTPPEGKKINLKDLSGLIDQTKEFFRNV